MSSEKSREEGDRAKNCEKYNYDHVLKEMGSVGRFQILLLCMSYYIPIPSGMNQVASVFVSAVPEYGCKIPELEHTNLTEMEIIKLSTPIGRHNRRDGCKRYAFEENCTSSDLSECFLNYTLPCTDGYLYDRSDYESTIVTEWNLVCDQLVWGTISTIAYFLGVCISSVIGGNLSDRFGRTRVAVIANIIVFSGGIVGSFAPSLAIFSVARFVTACAIISAWEANFVYMIELIPDRWRTPVGINVQAAFAIGYITLSGMSYIWRNWRHLQLAIAMFSLVYPIMWLVIPESPRWLLSKGYAEKGKNNAMLIARRNGHPLAGDVWKRALIDSKNDENSRPEKERLPHELFKPPQMRRITIKVMFIWFNVALVYYGLSLNVGSLVGDQRVNNALGGVSEVLSCPLAIFTIDRFGRRPVLTVMFIGSGISCIISAIANFFSAGIPALGIIGTVFALSGKLAVSAAFGIIYNYTAELYPTIVRGTAIGTGSMSARVGSICSPLIILVQYSIPWLTGTVFGLLSILAGFICLFLPETKSHSLTTTIEEAERFYEQSRYPTNSKQKHNPEEHCAMLPQKM